MKAKDIKNIAVYVYHNFSGDPCSLSNWLYSNAEEICSNHSINISYEYFFETVSDPSTKHFDRLAVSIKKQIECHHPSNRIELNEEADGIYITLSELGKNINVNIELDLYQRFAQIEKWSNMDKGLFYERFCTLFLCDLGLDAETTKASNDKGIDIVASYKTNLKESLAKFVFFDNVYLLGQAKFFTGKVDTPVIRKLVGDSIFIRFDQVNYVDISHNAIHLIVFSHSGFTEDAIEFSKRNKIIRIETKQIISIISASQNSDLWECYSYLIAKTSESQSSTDGYEVSSDVETYNPSLAPNEINRL